MTKITKSGHETMIKLMVNGPKSDQNENKNRACGARRPLPHRAAGVVVAPSSYSPNVCYVSCFRIQFTLNGVIRQFTSAMQLTSDPSNLENFGIGIIGVSMPQASVPSFCSSSIPFCFRSFLVGTSINQLIN